MSETQRPESMGDEHQVSIDAKREAELRAELTEKIRRVHEAERHPAKLWLWRNHVDGRPEYWAFDNPYPIHMDNGDPQTLGEPCGYALVKPSRNGRPDVSESVVLNSIERASARVERQRGPCDDGGEHDFVPAPNGQPPRICSKCEDPEPERAVESNGRQRECNRCGRQFTENVLWCPDCNAYDTRAVGAPVVARQCDKAWDDCTAPRCPTHSPYGPDDNPTTAELAAILRDPERIMTMPVLEEAALRLEAAHTLVTAGREEAFRLGMEAAAKLLDEEVHSVRALAKDAGRSMDAVRILEYGERVENLISMIRGFATDGEWPASVLGDEPPKDGTSGKEVRGLGDPTPFDIEMDKAFEFYAAGGTDGGERAQKVLDRIRAIKP